MEYSEFGKMKLRLKAPAKINLGLRILGKLANGFHQVETIYTQISLFDLIEVDKINEDKIEFPDKNNLVYRAAELVRRELEVKKGVKIKLVKKIPIGSGLGGGSSDAAQILLGLNKLWKLKLNKKELLRLGLRLGSDVAYQVAGGTKLERQGGKKAGEFKDLGKIITGWIVVCWPRIEITSKEAYKKIEYDKIGRQPVLWHNDFELWTFKQHPELKEIKELMLAWGAEKSLMSGKGSAIFGWFKDKHQAIIGAKELRKKYKQVYVTRPL